MKKFELPEIEVIYFSVEDVITTSGDLENTKKDPEDNGTTWN